MSQSSPNLGLPYIQPAQAQKHVTHNEAIERLDMLSQLVVSGFDAETPPALPVAGDTYALGANPNGDWTGYPDALAMYTGTGWMFIAPQTGWLASDPASGLRIWDGAAWIDATPDPETLGKLGINANADDTNRLSLSAEASLFNNAGGGHQIKINKAGAGDTASVLFQSGWTGHAEMGLAGDTSFSIKVSDGSNWYSPLRIDPAQQTIALAPNGTTRIYASDDSIYIDAPITGSAVQANATDNSDGKLLKTGAFGLGAPGAILTDLSVTDGSIASGFYQAAGTATDAPLSSGQFHILHSRRTETYGETQLAMAEGDGSLFIRSRGNGAWQGWQQVATSNHFTGDLSDPDRKPVFERGSNANGDYTRLADGTQFCWHELPLGFELEPQLSGGWTFPASFAQPAKVFCCLDYASLSPAQAETVSTVATDAATATGAQFRLIRAAGQTGFVAGDAVTVSVLAFGRWA